MQTKLTLRLESSLIEGAKYYAEQVGKSVSQMVADYFSILILKTRPPALTQQDLPPVTLKLKGLLRHKKIDPKDYRRHLESKYL